MRFELYAVVLAATAVVSLPNLEERQSYGTTWNEPYIAKPQNFKVTKAGATCDFQLAYERSSVDSRYDVQYLAEYAGGTSALVQGITGSLPRDNIWRVDGYSDSRGAQVVFFRDICKNGAAPRSLRVNFALKPNQFTYENRWTTGSLAVSNDALPTAPSGITLKVSSSPRSSTVTWRPVSGASSYVVLMEWLVDSELGPQSIKFVWAREVAASAISYTYNRSFTRATVVAIADGTIAGGAKRVTALDDVVDVFPS